MTNTEIIWVGSAFGLNPKRSEAVRAIMLMLSLMADSFDEYVNILTKLPMLSDLEKGYAFYLSGTTTRMECEVHRAFGYDCGEALAVVDSIDHQGDNLSTAMMTMSEKRPITERAFIAFSLGAFAESAE